MVTGISSGNKPIILAGDKKKAKKGGTFQFVWLANGARGRGLITPTPVQPGLIMLARAYGKNGADPVWEK